MIICVSDGRNQLSAQNERIAAKNHGAPAKMSSGPFDDVEDLTGVRRSRTPSKKRQQMEAWDEPEPVKIKKQKVKKTDTDKPLSAGKSSTQKKQKIAECAVRPKPRPKAKKATNNAKVE